MPSDPLADPAHLVDTLHRIARDAGALIREVYATDFAVDLKGPKDPVTVADRRANELICAALEAAYPGILVVAEESEPSRYTGFETAPLAFFVDPLDGTAEFVARNGEFVVMIGLASYGREAAGVVHAPVAGPSWAEGTSWAGVVGTGAWQIAPDGTRTPLKLTRVDAISSARFVYSRSHKSPRLDRLWETSRPLATTALGSAGLKCLAVARGLADAYVHPDSVGARWDVCGPGAIVVAAGGEITDQTGARFAYDVPDLRNGNGLVVTAGGKLHGEIITGLSATG